MSKRLDVLVAIPGPDVWTSSFALSLIGVASDFTKPMQGYGQDQRMRFFRKVGSLLPSMRQQLVEKALELGCTHIFFVDSDQSFPSNALRRLLSHNVPVVGCNVAIKRFPSAPTARAKAPEDPRGKVVYTTEQTHGLERVWRIGTGVLLVETEIFKYLGPKPWFNIRWHEEPGEFEGEDWYFMSLVEKAGYFVYIDQDLSWEVGHVGSLEYKHDFVVSAKIYADLGDKDATVVAEDLSGVIPTIGGQEDESRQGQAANGQRGSEEVRLGEEEGQLRAGGPGCEAWLEAHREGEVVCQG